MSRFFELTDCPCSSLALNCFQMSCCMPSPNPDGSLDLFESGTVRDSILEGEEGHSSSLDSMASSWMEHLFKTAPNTRFRDLVVTGTHNSGSCTIDPSSLHSAIGRCQNLTISDQLRAGIRLLDLRVGSHKRVGGHKGPSEECTKIYVRHGSMKGSYFIPILNQIDSFLIDHPKEIVVISLVPEYGVPFSSDQKLYLMKQINEIFGNRLIKAKEMHDLLTTWTLKDLSEKGKRILVLFDPRFCQQFTTPASKSGSNKKGIARKNSNSKAREWTVDELEAEFDVVNVHGWMRNLWFNTRETNDLLEYVLQDVHDHGCKKRQQFHCSQLVLTPGYSGLADVFQALAGTNPLRPISLSQHLYKDQTLNKFLRKNAAEPWNMVMLDFVDYCPWSVRFLTSLNFPVPITISLAAYNNGGTFLNVKSKMANFICRGRSMFLTNVLEDLQIDGKGGSLIVAYRLGDKAYFVLTIPYVDQSTLLLISYLATSSASVVKIPWSEQGLVHEGQIMSNTTSVRKLFGPAVRFNSTENNTCTFDLVG